MNDLAIVDHHARVNITYAGQNGDLPDPINFDSSDADVRSMLTEAIRSGGVPGIPADPRVSLSDYIVDRFEPTESRPFRMISLRPKTAFGF